MRVLVLLLVLLCGCVHGRLAPMPQGWDGLTCPETHQVKISRNGYYHLPGDKYYDETIPAACYRSAALARNAGFTAADPRYRDRRLP